jgi:hypothetical protein
MGLCFIDNNINVAGSICEDDNAGIIGEGNGLG